MKLKVFTDGGARGNPGPAASAFVVKDDQDQLLQEQYFYLGETTNNVAEYTAVIKALSFLVEKYNPAELEVSFYLDSNLVVQQLNGKFKIKQEHLKPLAQEIFSLNDRVRSVSFSFVPRALNAQADNLVNRCLDQAVM